MNIIEHIDIMNSEGWCDGCKHNADYCLKLYKLHNINPPCLNKE